MQLPQTTSCSQPDSDNSHSEKEEEEQKQQKTSKPVIPLREQDIFLPVNNIANILKQTNPPNGKVAKDAKICMQELVSEFISFITSEAAENIADEKRKTITGEDVLNALYELGFEKYAEAGNEFLKVYRESMDKTRGNLVEEGEPANKKMHLNKN